MTLRRPPLLLLLLLLLRGFRGTWPTVLARRTSPPLRSDSRRILSMEAVNDTNKNSVASEQQQPIKETAFGICQFRTMLSLLPDEAGSLQYDRRTPNFEGIALQQVPADTEHTWLAGGVEGARKMAQDLPGFLQSMENGEHGVSWGGFEFNVCRAHFVDNLILESVQEESPVRQVVFCGIGQDYRGMRYGDALSRHGIKVFELDLPNMMRSREAVKKEILKSNQNLQLPETFSLPIDFSTQHVSEVLLSCQPFDPKVPTLYLWEGVSYYLTPEAMRGFLQDIRSLMSKATRTSEQQQNRLFFDHLIDLPELVAKTGDGPAEAMLKAFESSEPLQAFLDFDQVKPVLARLGLEVHQQLRPPEMYRPYQTTKNKSFHLKPSNYFGIVVARYTEKP